MILGGIVGGTYGIGGGKNPVVYYYGKSQTQRIGENYTPAGQNNDRLAEFKTTADLVYNGGKSDLLTITNVSDAPTIDYPNGPDNSVLQFPAGRYHLQFQGYSEASAQGAFRVELRQIQTGEDDLIITYTTGWTTGESPATKAYQLIWTDFVVVDGTEKYYLLFPIFGSARRSHFLCIEKVA